MNTYYAPGDSETPLVIAIARDEGSARTKIAESLIARGTPDPRAFIDFTVIQVDPDDDPVVVETDY